MKLKRYPAILLGQPGTKPFLRPREVLRAAGVVAGQRVVDLGSGGGYFSLPAAELVGPGGRVYAVDRNGEVLASLTKNALQEGLRNIEPIEADFSALGERISPSPDWVILSGVLSMTPEPAVALRVAHELAGRAGRVIVVEWREGALFKAARLTIPAEELLRLARRAGFERERDLDGGWYHWAALFEARPKKR